jgi:hypothetical protein
MLKKLEIVIKKRGMLRVSLELNYKTTAAVSKWVKDQRVPPIAIEKVSLYLKRVSSES